MIVVDTSALLALVLGELAGQACWAALSDEPELLVSAGTLAEALIVADRRGVGDELGRLISGLAIETVPVTQASAARIAAAYAQWGKGLHPAGLNLGDCFAYELAKHRGCALLFIGEDFARTDVDRAL